MNKYSVTQYAELKKCSREYILKLINSDKLPKGVTAEKIGNSFVIYVEDNKPKQ